MIYFLSVTVFCVIILTLVALLILLEAKIVKKDACEITINKDRSKLLKVKSGTTLLSAFIDNGIMLASACGGKGSCGTCRCVVESGGGSVLPTELAHLTIKQKNENVRLACQVKVKQNMEVQIPENIFGIKKYHATVVSNESVSSFIKELIVKLDNETLEFKAGAYIQIDIPEYQDISFKTFNVSQRFKNVWDRFGLWDLLAKSNFSVFRAYSLANPPYEKEVLKFTVRIATPPPGKKDIPPGIGSSYVFSLKQGDKITLSGPYGEFFVKDTERELCFVGGGAGMAPMRCHILNQLNGLKTKRKVTFWYGARSKSELFYQDEFQNLEKQYPNFSFHIALSDPQPEDQWTGLKGFIHQCLYEQYLKNHSDPTEIEYYLCGPPMMINAIEVMLDNLGVEPEMIAYDKF